MSEPRLRLRGVTKSFGRNRVLKELAIDFMPGEIHALLGENGAGKSTLIKILAGVHSRDSGELLLDGVPFAPTTPAAAIHAGVATVFQELTTVPHLTIAENIALGKLPSRGGVLRRRRMRAEGRALARRVGLQASERRRVGELPRSMQQLVEIAKAIGRQARVFIFDEPTASLTDSEATKLFAIIRELAAEGAAIIYITHRMQEIDELADRVSVLRDGEITLTRQVSETTHDELLTAMTGKALGNLYPVRQPHGREERLLVSELQIDSGGPSIAFGVAAGEIFGVAGLLNSGKDELARVLGGVIAPAAGRVEVTGKAPRRRRASVAEARRQGVIYYPADRKREGLVLSAPVLRNMTMGALSQPAFSRGGMLRRGSERGSAAKFADRLVLVPPNIDAATNSFSGGNQQKVLLARGLAGEYPVHVFHDPTVGVDVGARVEVYRHIAEVAAGGAAVVLVSSDLNEVLALSHRVAIMREGGIGTILEDERRDPETALSHFFG